ncbi:MAG: hypothetical protein AB7V20_14355 [Phycisphaerales bacterium]
MAENERMRQEEQGFADYAKNVLEERIAFWSRQEGPGYDKQREGNVKRAHNALPELLIGRLDLAEDQTYYIGKTGVSPAQGADVVVMDWRAPMAKLFYQATRSDPQGVARRRSIRMRQGRVLHVAEEHLDTRFRPVTRLQPPEVRQPPGGPTRRTFGGSGPTPRQHRSPTQGSRSEPARRHRPKPPRAPGSPELRAEDQLLEELNSARTSEMADIVATLQADQDRLVRADPDAPLVIQGGPGTGKTALRDSAG